MAHLFGVLVVVLAGLLVLQVIKVTIYLLIVAGLALAVGAAIGLIGRWGYAAGALAVGLMAVGLLFKAIGTTLLVGIKFLPYLLVLYGLYVLLKAFNKGKS